MRVGYLGGLRLDASCRGKTSAIRRGYDLFHQLHEQDGPPIYFTSIVAENLPARRLLERGLDGMPTYRFIGEFVTLVIPRRRRINFHKPTSPVRKGNFREEMDCRPDLWLAKTTGLAIVHLLNTDYQRDYQFHAGRSTGPQTNYVQKSFKSSPHKTGIPLLARLSGISVNSKQAAVVQPVIANRIRWTRPLINLAAAFMGRPALPRVGQAIPQAFVSHLAVDPLRPQIADWLIRLLQGSAHKRNIDYLTIGFDARDPRLKHLRKVFKPREYVSRLYVVHWDDGAKLAASLDARLLFPEAALL